jgi:hypothetical protein
MSLPAMRSERPPGAGNVFRLLGQPKVAFGMAAILFLFMGQFALFTYLRPFLETVTRVDVSMLSLILLVIGVTGLVGTILIGPVLNRSVYGVLIVIPLLMAGIAVVLISFGGWVAGTALLLGTWGLIGTPAPVRLGDMAVADPADGRRGWRWSDGCDHSACDHAGRDRRGSPVRHERLPGHLRCQHSLAYGRRPPGLPGVAHGSASTGLKCRMVPTGTRDWQWPCSRSHRIPELCRRSRCMSPTHDNKQSTQSNRADRPPVQQPGGCSVLASQE